MRFTEVTCEQRAAMLRAVGVESIDDLFAPIPRAVRFQGRLSLPEAHSEVEVASRMRALASKDVSSLVCFAGGGCYDHHVPAIVDAVVSKPAFFTAYTPYQPEVSQGTLQAIYEYQSMICALTGMDVANASVYDGATALAEAALMAARITRRHTILVSEAIHPEWRAVLATYARAGTIALRTCPVGGGLTDAAAARSLVDDQTAAILVASPTFFGTLEDVRTLAEVAHAAGALLVASANPIMLGVMTPPGESGADIVVGEGQPLGNPMSFGGPGFGFFATRAAHLRQMPGRVVGRTVDADGRPGFVLTMQTREQHIRRERATSNICSNHSLNALAAAVHLCALGPEGLAGVAETCIAKAHFLHDALLATGRFERFSHAPFGYEFTLRYAGDVAAMQRRLLERGFLAGLDLGRFDPAWTGLVSFAVTERRTRAEMDALVAEVRSL